MSIYHQYKALIVDSDVMTRSKLKQAAHYGYDFSQVYTANSTSEGLARLSGEVIFDAVFISAVFGIDQILEYIEEAKQRRGGSDTAFIVVFPSAEDDPGKLATELVGGIDGFLMAPFSVEAVAEIAKIAEKIKRQNAERRLVAASGMIVSSMVKAIDDRAGQKASGETPRRFRKNLKTAVDQFRHMAGDSLEKFYETLIDQFSSAQPSAKGSNYTGPSERVKAMFNKKSKKKESTTSDSEEPSS